MRQYRAAVRQAVFDSDLSSAAQKVLLAALTLGPRPINRGSPLRTSARKRKSLPQNEHEKLIAELLKTRHPDGPLAAEFLEFNCRFYLRPCEWESAILVGQKLCVRNAKATNGRACGTLRRLTLSKYPREDINRVKALIASLAARARETGGFQRLWARLASRIARTCKRIGIKRVALYTSRHVGIATAKAVLTPEQLAATAGHKSTATAQHHYARRKSGRSPQRKYVPRPDKANLKLVIRSPQTNWMLKKQRLRANKKSGLREEVEVPAAATAQSNQPMSDEVIDRPSHPLEPTPPKSSPEPASVEEYGEDPPDDEPPKFGM